MTAHIVLLSIICILGILTIRTLKGNYRKKNILFLKLSFFCVWFIESMRGVNVGLDTYTYALTFKDINNYGFTDWSSSYWTRRWLSEPGWILLNKIVGCFTDNVQWLYAITAFIICFGIYIFIKYNISENQCAFWPFFLFMTLSYLYPSSMNLLREFIAISIGCNIYTLLRNQNHSKKDIYLSIILLLTAVSFHNIAFLYIFLFVVCLTNHSKTRTLLFIVMSIAILIGFPLALRLILRIIPNYSFYITQTNEFYESAGLSRYNLTMIILRVLCIGIIIKSNHTNENNKNLINLGMFNIVSLLLLLMTIYTNLATRTGYYFDIFIILMIPELLNKSSIVRKYRHTIYPIVFVACWMFFFFELSTSGARGTVPYEFCW